MPNNFEQPRYRYENSIHSIQSEAGLKIRNKTLVQCNNHPEGKDTPYLSNDGDHALHAAQSCFNSAE